MYQLLLMFQGYDLAAVTAVPVRAVSCWLNTEIWEVKVCWNDTRDFLMNRRDCSSASLTPAQLDIFARRRDFDKNKYICTTAMCDIWAEGCLGCSVAVLHSCTILAEVC